MNKYGNIAALCCRLLEPGAGTYMNSFFWGPFIELI